MWTGALELAGIVEGEDVFQRHVSFEILAGSEDVAAVAVFEVIFMKILACYESLW